MRDSGNVTAYHMGLKQGSSLPFAGALGFAARAAQVLGQAGWCPLPSVLLQVLFS